MIIHLKVIENGNTSSDFTQIFVLPRLKGHPESDLKKKKKL